MNPLTLPSDYSRIQVVSSFDELLATRFEGGVNALCWLRELSGDFAEVVEKLAASEGITALDEAVLNGLPVSAAGKVAIAVMLGDLRLLR